MNVSRMVEIHVYDEHGQEVGTYDLDVSTNLMSSKWPKLVYKILRECVNVCMRGGLVVMRGVLTPKF